MSSYYPIFCPNCDHLILEADQCPACRWSRPPAGAQAGDSLGEAIPLGRTVTGPGIRLGEMLWYAAPPEKGESPGALVSLHLAQGLVQRHALPGEEGIPVTRALVSDGQWLYLGLKDFALAGGRPPKALLALDPLTGQVVWRVETPSREMSPPAPWRELLLVAADSPQRVYAVDREQRALRWQAELDTDIRYAPVATEKSIVAMTGSLFGSSYLVALEPESGRKLWQQELTGFYGQPVAGPEAVYVPLPKAIVALDSQSGRPLWDYDDLRPTSRGTATALPRVAGDLLLLPTGGGSRQAPRYVLHAIDRKQGQPRWKFELPAEPPGHILVSPVILPAPHRESGEPLVIIGDRRGGIYALSLAEGRLAWGAQLEGRLAAEPVTVGDSLLLPSRDGQLHRLRWRPPAAKPEGPAERYERQKDWENAAVVHALAGELVKAGRCLLQAGDLAHALALFEAAQDPAGRADVLAAMGAYDAAIPLARELQDDARLAPWLLAAGRPDEAAETYLRLGRPGAAGAAYEVANRPLKAIEAYRQAEREDEVQRIAASVDLDLVGKAVSLLGWRAAAERYRSGGRYAAAADLLEKHGEWEEALALRRQLGHWGRVREICFQLGRWLGEAEAYEKLAQGETDRRRQRERWWQAGELWAEHQRWPEAERCFEKAGHPFKQAEMRARQKRWREAGDLIAGQVGLEPAEAALAAHYYEEAAQEGVARLAEWERCDDECAELYELAAHWHRNAGDLASHARCRQEADRWRRRPRLELGDGVQDRPFQQDALTFVELPLRNVSPFPAVGIQVLAGGQALGLEAPQPAGPQLAVLAPGEQQTIKIGLQPAAYSPDPEAPLLFELWLHYRDESRRQWQDGPFEISRPVAISVAQLVETGPAGLKVFLNGSRNVEKDYTSTLEMTVDRTGRRTRFQGS